MPAARPPPVSSISRCVAWLGLSVPRQNRKEASTAPCWTPSSHVNGASVTREPPPMPIYELMDSILWKK
eukprot:3566347-Ditylum_brightwellii.AAC.1